MVIFMGKLQIVLLGISVVCFLSACKQEKINSDMNSNISQIEFSEIQETVQPEIQQQKEGTKENCESTATNQVTQKDDFSEPDKPTQPENSTQSSNPVVSDSSTNENTEKSE